MRTLLTACPGWLNRRAVPVLLGLTAVVGMSLVPSRLARADDALAAEIAFVKRGGELYQRQCASCHGAQGEGVSDSYAAPLVGDLSILELTDYISETMPEGEPELCVAEDARAVATYIHGEFYSILAQVRNRPPQIDLARLTVRQYRHSLLDLAAEFTWQRTLPETRGLRAEYFKSKRRNKENRAIERVDADISFDFGDGRPDGNEEIGVEEFSITWDGGLIAPTTGWYDIVLEMQNGGQLWLNNRTDPLIDVRVRSGDQTEYTASIFLLGGRVYPLRLEYYKSKPETAANVSLQWIPPGGVREVIAERYFCPESFNESIVVARDFPPDDKSVGYERGVSVSQEWQTAVTFGAIEFADRLLSRIDRYAGLPKETEQHSAKLREFCAEFAGRAFRRPLTDRERDLFVNRHFDELPEDPYTATKRSILLTLTSPRFLFPGAADPEWDDYRVAGWLALALWDSLPDKSLREAAARGQLSTREQIHNQAQRMLSDPRTRAKSQAFFHQWLHFEHFTELSKASDVYPEFDPAVAADLKTSVDLFVDDVVWSESSDYRRLLLAEEIYLNGRLAQFYEVDLPADAPFQKIVFEPEHRAGLVTHPLLLSGLAYDAETSPIHRGVFVARSLLGRFLKPPPIAIAPEPAELHPGMTTRQRVEQQTASAVCMSCHGMINSLGFSLENFDAVGRFRTQEHGTPINSRATYRDRQGEPHELTDARGLAEFLVGSEEAHAAFSEQLFQYLIKQPIQAFGPELQSELQREFVEQNFHIRNLIARIAAESAWQAREMASNSAKTTASKD